MSEQVIEGLAGFEIKMGILTIRDTYILIVLITT